VSLQLHEMGTRGIIKNGLSKVVSSLLIFFDGSDRRMVRLQLSISVEVVGG